MTTKKYTSKEKNVRRTTGESALDDATCSAVSLPHHYAFSKEDPPRKLWDEEDMRDFAAAVQAEDAKMIEQLVNDLNQAHDEICKLQDLTPERQDWPEWTPQANSIRWAEKRLGKRLAKTAQWSEFPEQNVKAMPAAAESALSTSGLMLVLASKLLLHSGSGLVIRVLFCPLDSCA